MRKLPGLTRAVLGVVLLLGACAGGRATHEVVPAAGPALLAPLENAAPVVLAPEERTAIPVLEPEELVAPDLPAPALADSPALGERLPVEADVRPVATVGERLPAAAAARPVPTVVPPRAAGLELGYLLLDLETGQILAELNPDLPLIPASTTKLATAIVALDVLGPEHRYRTSLRTRGAVRNGVLEGDLILEGGGDPALDVPDLLGLAVRLRTSGIRAVAGRFLVDDTALPRLREIEPSQPLDATYNTSVGALSLAFNRVRVAWTGDSAAEVASLPPLEEARFERAAPGRLPPGSVELKRAGDEAVVWRIAAAGGRRDLWLPVKDPGLHAGNVFRWLARAQGIELGLPQRGAAPAGAEVVAVHESPPLRQLVRDMLVHSNNMMAEMIGLSAARRLDPASTNRERAAELLLDHLRHLTPEVDWQSAALGNFSGLDSTARMTPRQLAALVRYGWRTEALAALLPGSGWSGTLAQRLDGNGAALRVWAKTGTVHYGSALAGYLLPESGRPAVFVTMVSDINARTAYDARARRDAGADRTARAWNARARALQDDLVKTWLQPLPTS